MMLILAGDGPLEMLIRKLEGLATLPEEDKAFLREIPVSVREVGPHTDLIREGDNPTDVHLIASGFACRYKLIEGAKRQIVAYLLPGDFCDLHVFILKTMDHSIATLSRCQVFNIPRASIIRLLERPALAKSLLLATLVDEATLREWVTNLGQRQAEARIAHLFCELHARLEVVGLVSNGRFEVPVTQSELGDTVGLSTVHINRSLQVLREGGLIEFKGGRLQILDIDRLEKMSGFRRNYLHLASDDAKEIATGTT